MLVTIGSIDYLCPRGYLKGSENEFFMQVHRAVGGCCANGGMNTNPDTVQDGLYKQAASRW